MRMRSSTQERSGRAEKGSGRAVEGKEVEGGNEDEETTPSAERKEGRGARLRETTPSAIEAGGRSAEAGGG